MQTVSMATENMKGSQQNNDYQNIGIEVKNLRSAMAKSNFNMGQILPEHKHVDISAIHQKSPQLHKDSSIQSLSLINSAKAMLSGKTQPLAARVSEGNIGGPGSKGDFKTINQQNFKWIQPTAVSSLNWFDSLVTVKDVKL